jgi:hypothetical protein
VKERINAATKAHFLRGAFYLLFLLAVSVIPFALAQRTTAEIAAGSIAMGLGGYVAARGDAEHYAHEQAIEEHEVKAIPETEAKEVSDIFQTTSSIAL